LAGLIVLWTGRTRATSNTRIAIVATMFVTVFLVFVTYGAGSISTQPASMTRT
jgi:preprotein translocase subunit SecE